MQYCSLGNLIYVTIKKVAKRLRKQENEDGLEIKKAEGE